MIQPSAAAPTIRLKFKTDGNASAISIIAHITVGGVTHEIDVCGQALLTVACLVASNGGAAEIQAGHAGKRLKYKLTAASI